MIKKGLYLLGAMLFCITTCIRANNVQITNVTTTVANSVTTVNFNVSWDNSWHGGPANNYDAVWVFIKYYNDNNIWEPVNFTGKNNTIPSLLTATRSSDSLGTFIYRSADGFGNISSQSVTLGVVQKPGSFNIKVFGVEMVYIPQGPFFVGNGYVGGLGAHIFGNGSEGGGPFPITGAFPPTLGSSPGFLYDFWAGGGTYYPNNSFPTGYNAYYIMKYELSQGAYRDFLNSINTQPYSYLQERSDLVPSSGISFTAGTNIFVNYVRNTLKTNANGTIGNDFNANGVYNEAGDGEWTACGSLLWSDDAAYLDWAGLRPMTELEYEKACNGPAIISYPQFATGTFNFPPHGVPILFPFTNAETQANYVSTLPTNYINVLEDTIGGPLRNGYAANATTDRKGSGGSYYGVMEMTGNLWEPCVTLSNAAGRSFTGNTGDGYLSVYNGRANQPTWPGTGGDPNSANTIGEISKLDTAGISMRGGSYRIGYQQSITSAINNPSLFPNSRAKAVDYGCRGVRQP